MRRNAASASASVTAPGTDPASLLAERGAPPAQAGQAVAQQGQFDLGLAFGRTGVLGEDVQDYRRSIDGRPPQDLLQVPLLGRAQLVVEDHGVGVDGQAHAEKLLGLALAHVRGRVGTIPPLDDSFDHVGTGRVHQEGELVQTGPGGGRRAVGKGDPDQNDPLPDGPGDEGVGEGRLRGAHRIDARSASRSTSTSATLRVGPASETPFVPSVTRKEPPGL